MREIILDLLEFAKVGRTEDHLEEVDLDAIGIEILSLFHKQIEDKKAEIKFDNLPAIKSFKAPLRQVFQNLTSNALKYCREGVPPRLHVSVKEFNDYWQVAFADNGIGISEEYFHKIFVIFQRLHSKKEFEGTGIGLAITKKIVDLHGGTIWVESEYGKGSTFYFTIPKK